MTTSDNYRRVWQKVEDYAADPTRKPLLGNICKHVGVSERTLHTIADAMSGQSPARFVKQRRMMLARVMLACSRPGITTVTQIAMFCGFENLGRFAVNYRIRFGEMPSETLRSPLLDFDHPFADQFIRDVLQTARGTAVVPESSRHPWSSMNDADCRTCSSYRASAAP